MQKPQEKLRVFMTVVGRKGGMDHVADLITEQMQARPDLNIQVTRLTTRGRGNVLWGSFIFLFALARFLMSGLRGQVDLLHLNVAAYGSAYRKLILGRIARLLGIPYVVHLHGGRFLEFWPSTGPHMRRAVDRMFFDSEKIIVLGRFWADFIVGRLSSVQSKITILPNATKTIALQHEPETRIHIVFLGILSPLKGIRDLIEALAQLAKFDNWTATIAGNGEVSESRAQVKKLGIGDRVNIPGWLDPTEVDGLLRRTHILVLPSYVENLPMTILEGFAYGVAVIATPVGAIPEVIDHERNGLIVPVGDVDALATALRRLIEDSDLRRKLAAVAQRDHADRYDIKAYIPRLAAIWREAHKDSA